MKAFQVTSPGGPDKLLLTELPDPEPGPGEAVIKVAFAGCNWGDTQIRAGKYSFPVTYPVVPGYEVAGVVAAVGAGVTHIRAGDRVAALVDRGGYAQKCLASSRLTIVLPDDLDFATAAAFPIQALTAYQMLFTVFGIGPGDVVLVHAIGGGVGLFAPKWRFMRGRALSARLPRGKRIRSRSVTARRRLSSRQAMILCKRHSI